MFAAAQGRDAAVKVLLARKADPNAATQVSKIITMGERYKAKTEGKGTREITSEGGRSDITAMGGMTALMFAAREGHLGGGARAGRGRRRRQQGAGRRRAQPDHAGHRQRPARHRRAICSSTAPTPICSPRTASARCGRPWTPAGPSARGIRRRTSPRRRPRTSSCCRRCSPRAPIRMPGSCASRGIAPSTATGPTRSAPRRSGWPPRPTTWRRCASWSPAAPIPASRRRAAPRRCRWPPATASSRRSPTSSPAPGSTPCAI